MIICDIILLANLNLTKGCARMKWNEMNGFRKVSVILCFLCLITGLTLTILDAVDVLASIDILEDIIDCALWLSVGIAFCQKESLRQIACFIMSFIHFVCIFL